MLLQNTRLLQFLFCGFIASMMCVIHCAADSATNANAVADAPAGLVIVDAVYGNLSDPAATTNVTKIVAAMVNDDTLDFHPNNSVFGGDLAPGIPKQFRVDYTINGVPGTKSGLENARFRISTHPKPAPKKSRLVIVKAVYGDLPYGEASDVTDDLTDMIENDALKVEANNGNFGDTAPGKVKELRVDYTFDGRKKSVTVEEDDTLSISPRVEEAEYHKRIFVIAGWIVCGIVAASAIVAAVVMLAGKRRKEVV